MQSGKLEEKVEEIYNKGVGKKVAKMKFIAVPLIDMGETEPAKDEGGKILYTQNDILALNEILAMINISKYSQLYWESYLQLVERLREKIENKEYENEVCYLIISKEIVKFIRLVIDSMALKEGYSLNAFHLRTWKDLKKQVDDYDFTS